MREQQLGNSLAFWQEHHHSPAMENYSNHKLLLPGSGQLDAHSSVRGKTVSPSVCLSFCLLSCCLASVVSYLLAGWLAGCRFTTVCSSNSTQTSFHMERLCWVFPSGFFPSPLFTSRPFCLFLQLVFFSPSGSYCLLPGPNAYRKRRSLCVWEREREGKRKGEKHTVIMASLRVFLRLLAITVLMATLLLRGNLHLVLCLSLFIALSIYLFLCLFPPFFVYYFFIAFPFFFSWFLSCFLFLFSTWLTGCPSLFVWSTYSFYRISEKDYSKRKGKESCCQCYCIWQTLWSYDSRFGKQTDR